MSCVHGRPNRSPTFYVQIAAQVIIHQDVTAYRNYLKENHYFSVKRL